jgi:hypothetical protein
MKVPGAQTLAQMTRVTRGTKIPIIAGSRIERRNTSRIRVTGIVCTDIVIVAVDQSPFYTCSGKAMVPYGAGVAIVAWPVLYRMETALQGTAGIRRTTIAIITIQLTTALASTIETVVAGGAHIPIVTRRHVDLGDTASLRVARVVGANILVITD